MMGLPVPASVQAQTDIMMQVDSKGASGAWSVTLVGSFMCFVGVAILLVVTTRRRRGYEAIGDKMRGGSGAGSQRGRRRQVVHTMHTHQPHIRAGAADFMGQREQRIHIAHI